MPFSSDNSLPHNGTEIWFTSWIYAANDAEHEDYKADTEPDYIEERKHTFRLC